MNIVFTKPTTYQIPTPEDIPDISPLLIEENGVRLLLQNHEPYKAQGPDSIPARNLQLYLTLIFIAFFQQGKLPTDWKKAFVVPVFKKAHVQTPQIIEPYP